MKPMTAVVNLGYRSVDHEVAPVQVIHRGKHKTLIDTQRRRLKRRQAIEPVIGHTKHENGMHRCWLKGSQGDALHAVPCAPGFNIPRLMLAIVRLGQAALLLCLQCLVVPAWATLRHSTTASSRSTTVEHRLAVTLG